MPKKIECPFYMYDRQNMIRCEGSCKNFRDRNALRQYTTDVCGDVHNYKICETAKKLEQMYLEEIENEERSNAKGNRSKRLLN